MKAHANLRQHPPKEEKSQKKKKLTHTLHRNLMQTRWPMQMRILMQMKRSYLLITQIKRLSYLPLFHFLNLKHAIVTLLMCCFLKQSGQGCHTNCSNEKECNTYCS